MSNRKLLIPLLLATGFLLASCGPLKVYSEPAPPQRTLTVTGTGSVTLTPDIAYISIGVYAEDPSAASAVQANNERAQKVIQAMKSFGVEDKDITTTNFSLWLKEIYDDKGNVVDKVYAVQNTVQVKVRQLDKVGDLLDAVIKAGANTINGISFDVEDQTEAFSQARTLAVESARKQAEALAEAAGVKLGEIQTINFYESIPYPALAGKGGGEIRAEYVSAPPISSGQFELTVTVTMVYELK